MTEDARTCEQCGGPLARHPHESDTRWEVRRFCSNRCSGLSHRTEAWVPTSLNLGGSERQIYGATTSIRRLDTDERRTIVHTGCSPTAAVADAVAEIRELQAAGEPWVVCAISTPSTIFRDLQANRITVEGDGSGAAAFPETTYLGRAGASDLLDPVLLDPPTDPRTEGARR